MAFDIATSPQQDLDKFRLVSRWIMKCKDQQHNEARRDLDMARLAHSREIHRRIKPS